MPIVLSQPCSNPSSKLLPGCVLTSACAQGYLEVNFTGAVGILADELVFETFGGFIGTPKKHVDSSLISGNMKTPKRSGYLGQQILKSLQIMAMFMGYISHQVDKVDKEGILGCRILPLSMGKTVP